MSYWHYWKLNDSPFAGDRASTLFRGESVEEAIARIEFLVNERRSLAMLLGPSGVGKTTLLAYLLKSPPRQPDRAFPQVCLQSLLGLGTAEIPRQFAQKLTGRPAKNVEQAWAMLADFFAAAKRTESQVVLLVDDVESCSLENEEDLIRIANYAAQSRVTMLLASESHLKSAVSTNLQARSSLQIDLCPWTPTQIEQFLRWRLSDCGRQTPIFAQSAISRISELSGGIPRRVLQLAELALVAGAAQKSSGIDGGLVAGVSRELPVSVAA